MMKNEQKLDFKSLLKDEYGIATVSSLIIICVLMMISFYVYDISSNQQNSFIIFKTGMASKNLSVSEAEKLLGRYKNDVDLWKVDCKRVQNIYFWENAIVVDEVAGSDEIFEKKSARAYLMHYKDDIYLLVAEANVDDCISQICIYLEMKDEELIVQRWER